MKVKVKQEACIGCGACTAAADELFKINEEGVSVATTSVVPDELIDKAKDAIQSCPTDAIVEVSEDNE